MSGRSRSMLTLVVLLPSRPCTSVYYMALRRHKSDESSTDFIDVISNMILKQVLKDSMKHEHAAAFAIEPTCIIKLMSGRSQKLQHVHAALQNLFKNSY